MTDSSNSLPNSEPILSLVASYRFSPADNGEYLALDAEQKRQVDLALMQEFLQTFTFPVREAWIDLATGPEFDYMTRGQVREIINQQLATLSIADKPKYTASVPPPDDPQGDPDITYLFIPPHEHRSTYYEPLVIQKPGGEPKEWRLDRQVLGQRWTPRVVAALSVGFPTPDAALPAGDRVGLTVDAFLSETAGILEELLRQAGQPVPDGFGNPLDPPNPHLGPGVGMNPQLFKRLQKLRALRARRGQRPTII